MDEYPDYSKGLEFTSEKISEELRQAFESVAKIALRASARSGDSTTNPLDRVQEATKDLTLIVEEAMRGIRQSMLWLAAHAVMIGSDRDE